MQPEVPTKPAKLPMDPRKKKIILWSALGAVGALVLAGGAYAFGHQAGKSAQVAIATPTPTVSTSAEATAVATPTPKPELNPSVTDDGVTWLAKQEKTSDLKLFKNLVQGQIATYYKVGSDNGKDIIIATVSPEGPGNNSRVLFLKTDKAKYELIQKHSPDVYDSANKYVGPETTSSVTINSTKLYKSIAVQKEITTKSVTFMARDGFDYDFYSQYEDDKTYKLTEFTTTPYGKLYSAVIDKLHGLATQTYVLRRPDNTVQTYQLSPKFVTDDGVPQVTWADKSVNGDAYRYDSVGSCGSVTHFGIISNGKLDGLKATGTTSTKESVYEFTSADNEIVKYYINDIMQGKYYDSTKNDEVAITATEFLAKHGLFAYKDALDRVILFSSQVYGPQAECGKPVVYLYPTKITPVSVKVDAKISVSDPAYNNGWNVTAQPDGTLINSDGKSYDSLFWEGTGKEYPSITQGFVVKRDNVEATLRDHLAKLGLNQKESADFMEFWMPKMPNKPYVRLTWFGTKQMDRLAPLAVSPQPDSVIRIFLDFQGLDQPINLPTQNLSAIARKGFTVVEWGGLLRK